MVVYIVHQRASASKKVAQVHKSAFNKEVFYHPEHMNNILGNAQQQVPGIQHFIPPLASITGPASTMSCPLNAAANVT